ncbi:SAF domain-containing protein [Myceligenerans halotolerans]
MSSDTSVGARRTGVGGSAAPPATGNEARGAGPRVPAPPKPTRARRRPAVIALGLALVALGILASVYLTTTLGRTHKVLALTDDVARGERIQSSDLTTVDLPTTPTQLDPVSETAFQDVVDQYATADLLEGSLLTPGSYVESLQPAEGRSIVGIALNPSQMPAGTPLNAGDQVRIIETPVSGGDAPIEEPYAIPAVIATVDEAPVGDQTVVDVEVARNQAAALAARAATGRVALVLDAAPAGGNAPTSGDAPAGGDAPTGGDAPAGGDGGNAQGGDGGTGAANGEPTTDGNG